MAANNSLNPLEAPGLVRDLLATNMLLLRREHGLSQEALALEAGLHRTFIAHVELYRPSTFCSAQAAKANASAGVRMFSA